MVETDITPEPFSPADCDLRGYDYMPLHGHRLFSSTLYTESTDAEFRAALRLWWSAWQQCPAGSLPNSDAALAMLSDYGRDLKGWQKVRAKALHGFVLCSDGRLYHPMLCEEAVRVFGRRLESETKRETDRERLRKWRENRKMRVSSGDGNGDETRFNTRVETSNVAVEIEKEKEKRKEESTSSLRSDASETPIVTSEKPPGRRRRTTDPNDPKALLWAEGRRIMAGLTGRSAKDMGSTIGVFVDDAKAEDGSVDHAMVLDVIKQAANKRPDNVISWVRAAIKARMGPPNPEKMHRQVDDPWGINAWIARRTDVRMERFREQGLKPAINGWDVLQVAEDVATAAYLPPSWRGNWDCLALWFHDEVAITPEVQRAISAFARRIHEEIHSIALFDSAVRGVSLRVVAGREYG